MSVFIHSETPQVFTGRNDRFPCDVTHTNKPYGKFEWINPLLSLITQSYTFRINREIYPFSSSLRWVNVVVCTIVRIITSQAMPCTNSREMKRYGGSGFGLSMSRGPISSHPLPNRKWSSARPISCRSAIAWNHCGWKNSQED